MNRDHSVIFEIASKHCISDSFVDHDGYSICSEGFLPTVVEETQVGVARGHQRADTLKPYSQKTSQSNHTRTTALSNSVKPSLACGATQDGWVMVERSDRTWSTGEVNGKPLQYSCLENPMNRMKRQNNMLMEISGEITPERMKEWSQSKNNIQL